jgi:hypothetical protein
MMSYPVTPIWWFVEFLTAAVVLVLVIYAANEGVAWAIARVGGHDAKSSPMIDNGTYLPTADVDVDRYDKAA